MSSVQPHVRDAGADPTTGATDNDVKFQWLLLQAQRLLRLEFRKAWKLSQGLDWDDDKPNNPITFAAGCGKRLFQHKGAIQKELIQSGDVENWDIALLIDILEYVRFSAEEDQADQRSRQRNQHLQQLRQVRNQWAHRSLEPMADTKFEQLWNQAAPVILFFGGTEEELQKILNSSNFDVCEHGEACDESNREVQEVIERGDELCKSNMFASAIEMYTLKLELEGLGEINRGALYAARASAYLGEAQEIQVTDPGPAEHTRQLALLDAKHSMSLRPTWHVGYFRAGQAYYNMGKFEKAVRAFSLALSLAPHLDEIQAARDESRRRLGIQTRNDHFDARHLYTFDLKQQTRAQLERYLGRKVSTKLVNRKISSTAKRIRGQADVFKGHDYYHGTGGVEQNYETAARHYSKAVGEGNAEGMYSLALLHHHGKGVKQDFEMEIKLLKDAAARPLYRDYLGKREQVAGVSEAEHALGVSYYEGVGVPQSYEEARRWYEKAAGHGYSGSMYNLGTLYDDGRGVPIDKKKASDYWRQAASLQDPHAMHALALHCINVTRDATEAKMWFEMSLAKGDPRSEIEKNHFYAALAELYKQTEKVTARVVEWEMSKGLKPGEMSLKDRMERANKGMVHKEAVVPLQELEKLCNAAHSSCDPAVWRDVSVETKVLEEHASRGSLTAKGLLKALKHFEAAGKLATTGIAQQNIMQFCHELTEATRHDRHNIIQFEPEVRDKLGSWLQSVLKSLSRNLAPCDFDRELRICCTVTNTVDVGSHLSFLEASTKKYPQEVLLHQRLLELHSAKGDLKSALKAARQALINFPNDLNILFKAATSGLHIPRNELPLEQGIAAYETFLQIAPPDYPLVPRAYYEMGLMCTDDVLQKNPTQACEPTKGNIYYNMGLDAEKEQLPCFLPYECTSKAVLKNLLTLARVPPTKSLPRSMVALMSPDRVKKIRAYRKFIQESVSTQLDPAKLQDGYGVSTRSGIVYSSPPGTMVVGLRCIVFGEMTLKANGVHTGCILMHLGSIEDPVLYGQPPSQFICLLLEDSTADICPATVSCNVHNVKEYEQLLQELGVGARVSIINPITRTGQDEHLELIIENPSRELVLNTAGNGTTCRFCGKPDAKLKCSRCNRAFYCERECQLKDWSKMKHKLICIPR